MRTLQAKARPARETRDPIASLWGLPAPREGLRDQRNREDRQTCTRINMVLLDAHKGMVQMACIPEGHPQFLSQGCPAPLVLSQLPTQKKTLVLVAAPGRGTQHTRGGGQRPGPCAPTAGISPAPPPQEASQRPFVPPSPCDSSS